MAKRPEIVLDVSRKKVLQIFEERFASSHFKSLFDSQPWVKANMLSYIHNELEIEELEILLEKERQKSGSLAAHLSETDGGNPCISPLQNLLNTKISRRQGMERSRTLKDILEGKTGGNKSEGKFAAYDYFKHKTEKK